MTTIELLRYRIAAGSSKYIWRWIPAKWDHSTIAQIAHSSVAVCIKAMRFDRLAQMLAGIKVIKGVRLRVRWTLTALFLLTTAVAVALGCFRHWGARRLTAMRRLNELGAQVSFSEPTTFEQWFGKMLPAGYLRQIEAIDLGGSSASDEDLRAIAVFSELKKLYLYGCKIGPGTTHLAQLKNLEELGVRETGIVDDDLTPLGGLPRLWLLDLRATKITDAGLLAMGTCPSIEYLCVQRTRVRGVGVKSFPNLVTLSAAYAMLDDEGMAIIGECRLLQQCFLERTRMTDASVPYLCQLTGLKYLDVSYTFITDDGEAVLRKQFPSAQLLFGYWGAFR